MLLDDVRKIGVENGDTVLVHSAWSTVKADIYEGFAALQEAVGLEGTLVFPAFSFNKKWGATEMGLLTVLASSRVESERVPHPVHSFTVIGKLAKEFGEIRNKSSYGADSVFGRLMELDGKILIIGLDYQNSFTFAHYVEQTIGVSYREIQDLGDGYTIYGRKKGVMTWLYKMGEILDETATTGKIGQAESRLIRARDAFDVINKNITNEPGLMYKLV